MHYRYTAFGLKIRSVIPFLELVPGSEGDADVSISYGSVPEHLANPTSTTVLTETSADRFLLRMPAARFEVTQGAQIVIDRVPGSEDGDIRALTLGCPLAALLMQRGALVLHASGIATRRGAVVFAGASGRGKSTLVAALVARGHRMLTDDLAAIEVQPNGEAVVKSAFPLVKLGPDVMRRITALPATVVAQRPDGDKLALSLTDRFEGASAPLFAIYTLNTHNQSHIDMEPAHGVARLRVLNHHLFLQRSVSGILGRVQAFRSLSSVASTTPTVRVIRPKTPFMLDELVDRIEAAIA
jgi:hypothetical protein